MRIIIFLLSLLFISASALSQSSDVHIKVYDFDEGLSHRNTFKILQDEAGFIWMATINGLNRFDGYEFVHYSSQEEGHYLPQDAYSDMLIDEQNRIWLASPDFITVFDPLTNEYREIKVKEGDIIQRESVVPHSLYLDQQGRLWMAMYDERTAENRLMLLTKDGQLKQASRLEGQYSKRPAVQLGDTIYVGAYRNVAWKLNSRGAIQEALELPGSKERLIAQIQARGDSLYLLCSDGMLYVYQPGTGKVKEHPLSTATEMATTLFVEPNGDIWIGGRDLLLYYNKQQQATTDYNASIFELAKSTCTYRQVFRDRSGVIWIASDFGAVRLHQSQQLFSQYLEGGSEYCSNIYCSTRGIAEDEQGRIYISYYNSIHVLDPETDNLRPLFASNDFFNYPFGLTHFDGSLWTGNGRRIDLQTRTVDTIFNHPSQDLGHVIAGKDSTLWLGYLNWLYRYDAQTEELLPFEDAQGRWDSLSGNISYLHQSRNENWIWAGTLSNGLHKIDKDKGRVAHYHSGEDSPVRLRHNQVNVIYEDGRNRLWLGTGMGLHCLALQTGSLTVFTTEDGLPNNFINGILPEGDSCLWVSTDNGLSRFSIKQKSFSNFFVEDGVSANEFNRISFFKSKAGRMYFGGLNGVSAFYPGPHFLDKEEEQQEAPVLFTRFSKFDGYSDSLISRIYGLAPEKPITISAWDRIFSFQFALADYRNPSENVFSYWLEGYESDWSAPTENTLIRYNNIPAGHYTFRVRAKAGEDSPAWNSQQLAIRVKVQEPFYKAWWFWLLCSALLAGGIFAIMRYRIYMARKRERALEETVRERTRELEAEKQKSEELLLNILPAETAEELKKFGSAKAKRHELVTVMFSDFKGFSRISEQMDPEDLVAEIDYCFRAFDEIMEKFGLEKIKTVGDAYLCVGGIRDDDGDEAARVTMAAMKIQEFMEALAIQRQEEGSPYFEARIGIHTGPVVAGIVGIKKFAYDIWGDTVNLAARMETNGEAGKVNISETTYLLIRQLFRCQYQGQYTETDGEDINMYFVEEYLGD